MVVQVENSLRGDLCGSLTAVRGRQVGQPVGEAVESLVLVLVAPHRGHLSLPHVLPLLRWVVSEVTSRKLLHTFEEPSMA
jgi:hypothetical protein